MNIETMTMTEKLLVIRRMIEHNEIMLKGIKGNTVISGFIDDKLSAELNKDKNAIIIRL